MLPVDYIVLMKGIRYIALCVCVCVCVCILSTRVYSLEKTLMLGKTKGKRRGWLKMRWFDSITDSVDINLNKFREIVEDGRAWCDTVHGAAQFSD